MAEDALLTGKLEPTNEPYAVAKIAGIKLCESYNRQYGCDFRSVMPTNLYGPGDNYHPENSHVLPAMIRRFHEAKLADAPSVVIWGTGSPKREFLYVDDMASACVHVMDLPRETYAAHTDVMASHINVGSGEDLSIAELAQTGERRRGLPRRDPLRHQQARRRAAQAARHLPAFANSAGSRRISLRAGIDARLRRFLQRRTRRLKGRPSASGCPACMQPPSPSSRRAPAACGTMRPSLGGPLHAPLLELTRDDRHLVAVRRFPAAAFQRLRIPEARRVRVAGPEDPRLAHPVQGLRHRVP